MGLRPRSESWSGSLASQDPLVIATAIVVAIGAPEAEHAQPRALIGGDVVAALFGFAMLHLTGTHARAG